MHTNDHLFPQRLTRRDFLKTAGVATATAAFGLTAPGAAHGRKKKAPVRIGGGYYTYEAVEGWGQLPAGMKYGLGCGVVVDRSRWMIRSGPR